MSIYKHPDSNIIYW